MSLVIAMKEKATQFATQFNLDAEAVELALVGTIERVNAAIAKGEELTPELIEAAFVHWFDSQQKLYQDLLENKDGKMDKLAENIYEQLILKNRMATFASFSPDDFDGCVISKISRIAGIYCDDDAIMSFTFNTPFARFKAENGEAVGIEFDDPKELMVYDSSMKESDYYEKVRAIMDALDEIRLEDNE